MSKIMYSPVSVTSLNLMSPNFMSFTLISPSFSYLIPLVVIISLHAPFVLTSYALTASSSQNSLPPIESVEQSTIFSPRTSLRERLFSRTQDLYDERGVYDEDFFRLPLTAPDVTFTTDASDAPTYPAPNVMEDILTSDVRSRSDLRHPVSPLPWGLQLSPLSSSNNLNGSGGIGEGSLTDSGRLSRSRRGSLTSSGLSSNGRRSFGRRSGLGNSGLGNSGDVSDSLANSRTTDISYPETLDETQNSDSNVDSLATSRDSDISCPDVPNSNTLDIQDALNMRGLPFQFPTPPRTPAPRVRAPARPNTAFVLAAGTQNGVQSGLQAGGYGYQATTPAIPVPSDALSGTTPGYVGAVGEDLSAVNAPYSPHSPLVDPTPVAPSLPTTSPSLSDASNPTGVPTIPTVPTTTISTASNGPHPLPHPLILPPSAPSPPSSLKNSLKNSPRKIVRAKRPKYLEITFFQEDSRREHEIWKSRWSLPRTSLDVVVPCGDLLTLEERKMSFVQSSGLVGGSAGSDMKQDGYLKDSCSKKSSQKTALLNGLPNSFNDRSEQCERQDLNINWNAYHVDKSQPMNKLSHVPEITCKVRDVPIPLYSFVIGRLLRIIERDDVNEQLQRTIGIRRDGNRDGDDRDRGERDGRGEQDGMGNTMGNLNQGYIHQGPYGANRNRESRNRAERERDSMGADFYVFLKDINEESILIDADSLLSLHDFGNEVDTIKIDIVMPIEDEIFNDHEAGNRFFNNEVQHVGNNNDNMSNTLESLPENWDELVASFQNGMTSPFVGSRSPGSLFPARWSGSRSGSESRSSSLSRLSRGNSRNNSRNNSRSGSMSPPNPYSPFNVYSPNGNNGNNRRSSSCRVNLRPSHNFGLQNLAEEVVMIAGRRVFLDRLNVARAEKGGVERELRGALGVMGGAGGAGGAGTALGVVGGIGALDGTALDGKKMGLERQRLGGQCVEEHGCGEELGLQTIMSPDLTGDVIRSFLYRDPIDIVRKSIVSRDSV